MNTLPALIAAVSFSFAPGFGACAEAQDAETAQINEMARLYNVMAAPEVHATQACGIRSETATYPGNEFLKDENGVVPTETATFSVTSWTGGCENGLRSGHGVIVTRKDVSDTSKFGSRTTKIIKSEGTFVRGLRQGLWCVLDYKALSNGEKDDWDFSKEVGCHLVISSDGDIPLHPPTSPYYRRLTDGRWQQMDNDNKPVLPEVYLPAGSVETESARLIAEAQAGRQATFQPMNLETNLLEGLIAGAHIGEGAPILLSQTKGKRVALILSTNMLAELDRFNAQRRTLLDASATLTGRALAERNRFEAASQTDRLLQALAAGLRRQTGEMTAVDDLSGLAAGKFDYAYVLDWHSLSRLDVLGKFKDFPQYEIGQAWGTNPVVGQSVGGFLISPEMKVVWRQSSSGTFDYRVGDCTDTRTDRGCDAQYFKILADFYEKAWTSNLDQSR